MAEFKPSDTYLANIDLHEIVEGEKRQQGIDLIDNVDNGYESEARKYKKFIFNSLKKKFMLSTFCPC